MLARGDEGLNCCERKLIHTGARKLYANTHKRTVNVSGSWMVSNNNNDHSR